MPPSKCMPLAESFLPPISCVHRGRDAVDQIRRAVGTLGIGKMQQFKIFLDVVADSARGGDAFFHATPISAGVTLVHCPGDGRMHVASKTMHGSSCFLMMRRS